MLKQKIKQDLKDALKGKRGVEVSTLRLVLAAILNKEKEKRSQIAKAEKELGEERLVERSQLTDEETVQVLLSEVKKRKEAILDFERGERLDLAEGEKAEIEILQKYLPEQLPKQEIEKLARGVISELGAEGPRDIGKVMSQMMPKVKGRVEGSVVSEVVKNLLTN